MKDKLIVFIEILLLCALIGIVCSMKPARETDYFEKFEIYKLRDSKPEKEFVVDQEIYRQYDGIYLVYNESESFQRAEIYDPKHKLEKDISVGSKRSDVEKAFGKEFLIKDLPENEWGFIENVLWVNFEFDKEDRVKLIKIYHGP